MIDKTRIGQLRADIGDADFFIIVAGFLQEGEAALAKLRRRNKAGDDSAQIPADLHFLKGCAVNLGFCAVAEYCETHKANPAPDITVLTAHFQTERQELSALIGAIPQKST